MKRKLFIVLTSILLAGLFCVPTAFAFDEQWEEIYRMPDGPYYYHHPRDTAHDSSGNLYVLGDDRVKKYTPDGILDTGWAGDGILGGKHGNKDDEFDTPSSIAIDGSDNLYISDTYNHRIKRYTPDGKLDTSWGGGDGIIGTQGSGPEQFSTSGGIAVDNLNNLYVADVNNNRVKRYTLDGSLDTSWGGGDGIIKDSIISGSEVYPTFVDVDDYGNLYIADIYEQIIRCTPNGVRDTSWGGGDGIIDCTDAAGSVTFSARGIAVDQSSNLYASDTYRVVRYSPNGDIDTSWGGGDGEIGTDGLEDDQFSYTNGLSVDASNNLFTCDNFRVKKHTSDGNLDISWCNRGVMSTGGTALHRFLCPHDVAVDENGNMYVADKINNCIKRYTQEFLLDTSWGNGGIIGGALGSGANDFYDPGYIELDAQNNLYVLDRLNYRIKRYTPDGLLDIAWAESGMITESYGTGNHQMSNPWGLTVDAFGYVYLPDTENHRIKRYTPSGELDTSWGGGDGIIGAGQGGGADQFYYPSGLAVDVSGNLYVADAGNFRIKRYTSSGVLDTSWGGGDGIIGGTQGDDIDQFENLYDIAVNPKTGAIYVVDTSNHRIVQYTQSGESPHCIYRFNDAMEYLDSPPFSLQATISFYQGRLYTACLENNYVMVLYDEENGSKLDNLSVFGETICGFDPNVFEYSVVVSKNATEVDISADPFYKYSTVSGIGTHTLSPSNSTKLTVTVTGENGCTQDYILNVLRDGKDVGLADLTVDGQTVSSFNEAKTNYTISAPYGREYIDIGAVGNKYCEEITGTGIVKLTGDTTVFNVVAKAIDGSARVYMLTIKKGSMDASWINAVMDGQKLGSGGISIVVPKGGKTLTLRVTLDDGTYIDLPVTLSVQTSDTTPTPQPSTQPTQSPVTTEAPETIPNTSDTADGEQFTASVDGVEMGNSVKMEVPQSGKCVIITIELPDGNTYDVPVELIPEGSVLDNAEDINVDSSSVFTWGWIVICVLGMAAVGFGVWVFLLKRK